MPTHYKSQESLDRRNAVKRAKRAEAKDKKKEQTRIRSQRYRDRKKKMSEENKQVDAALVATPGQTMVAAPGQAMVAAPGQALVAAPGQALVAAPGQAMVATPGQTMVADPPARGMLAYGGRAVRPSLSYSVVVAIALTCTSSHPSTLPTSITV